MISYIFNSIFFNSTKINEEELDNYLHKGFLTDEFMVERFMYLFFCILCIIISVIFLALFYKLRNSYIIRQRNFELTFVGGIFIAVNIFLTFLPQLMKVPCSLTVFSANILNTIVNLIFLTRSLCVILFYHFNIFKFSSISRNKFISPLKESNISEPNNYLHLISRKINIINTLFIFIPSMIAIIATIVIYAVDKQVREECKIFTPIDSMYALKYNYGEKLYLVVIGFGFVFMIFNTIFAILLFFVKDVNKYGVKFECLSVSIMILIFNVVNIILQKNATVKSVLFENNKNPRRGFLDIYEKTKGGKMLFTINLTYMFFSSIILPIIHYYISKRTRNANFQDPMNSIQYFNKVLNTPSLVNELREIAIKEFSVENVLFWENYQILQKMVCRYHLEYKKAKELCDENIVKEYDFENYYFQQLQNYSDNSFDDCSYDPNMPIPKEILPYFKSFYHMFIDYNSPAVVNISGTTEREIYNEICVHPTVGIYDTAKNEVVEMMYNSIYPILIKNNKKYMANTLY